MKVFLKTTILTLLITWLCYCSERQGRDIRSEIIDSLSAVQGTFAVAFKDLESSETLFINEEEEFHAASTMKTPVMIRLFQMVDSGLIRMEDTVLIKNEFNSIVDGSRFSTEVPADSAEYIYQNIGSYTTLFSLTEDMITWSSNLATNILMEIADPEKVTQTTRELGAKKMKVLRGVSDLKALEKGLSNTTTAYDLMVILESIATNSAASEGSCQKMTTLLLAQRIKDSIPLKLPEGVKVAHKGGAITGVRHDSGIIYLPDGRIYILVLLSKDLIDEQKAMNMMANVSYLLYQYVIESNL